MMPSMKTSSRGMTLIELMTAITVLGILVAVAAPSFRSFTANNKVVATTNDLVTALNLARSEALRRGGNAVACASTTMTGCSGSGNWANGWIVFNDPNANNTVDAGELLQVWAPSGGNVTVTAQDAGGTAAPRVVYNTMGMGQLPPGGRIRFQIVSTGCKGLHAGQTDVLLAGTIQSTKVACP
jgi:type IV fimbrial biogenesis protein FimT